VYSCFGAICQTFFPKQCSDEWLSPLIHHVFHCGQDTGLDAANILSVTVIEFSRKSDTITADSLCDIQHRPLPEQQ
jgi:hypothetical protein